MELIAGIDVGTSSVKVLCIDEDGNTVARSRVGYAINRPQPGWVEQDPSEWWKATCQALKQLSWFRDDVGLGNVSAVGLSGQMHTSVILTGKGEVHPSAISWLDQRTTDICAKLSREYGEMLLHETGNPVSTGFTLPKLLWLRDNEPRVYDEIEHVLLPKDYIRFMLTNEVLTDPSDASGTLLLNVSGRTWSREITSTLDISPDILPPIAESCSCGGHVTPSASKVTGLMQGIPVFIGACDVASATAGVGATTELSALVSVGTSGQVVVPSPNIEIDALGRLNLLCHGFAQQWLVMGAVQDGGLAVDWFWQNFFEGRGATKPGRLTDADTGTPERRECMVQEHSPIFLPYLTGARTPHMDANASGVFFGLRLHDTIEQCRLAVIEGIAFSLRDCLESVEEKRRPVQTVILSGGAAKYASLTELLPDVLAKPVKVSHKEDASAYGAVLWANQGFSPGGKKAGLDVEEPSVRTLQPNKYRTKLYERRFRLYQQLYQDLRDRFQEHESSN